ncbi:MAG: hypothetical protein BGO12_14425 [Verrucomicrobia bacterium 61-8]|nr:prepilin-type N-terminal cleavage/methylation domain-containing protein [Verrucomicrobiota bacterium]OJV04632.1 MAG: hypothetical protein BGO12_14425 [Verrucomicrobia bacterium 61-8]
MKRRCFVRIYGRRAFSLVELLAAVAVFVILALVLVQITNATNQSTRASTRMLDAASQSRLVFDRLGRDLANLLKRDDIDFHVGTGANADLLGFFSLVPSASVGSNRGLSLIAYRIGTPAGNVNHPCLLRAGKALSWDATEFFGLAPTSGLPLAWEELPAGLQPGQDDFDLLAPGVIRMVVGFQLYPDNGPAVLANGAVIEHARGQVVYSPPIRVLSSANGGATAKYVDLCRISALVVGLVVIDQDSLIPLSAAQVQALSGAFPEPMDSQPPLQTWGDVATGASGNSLLSGIPLPARQAVRVYQRFYPLNPFAGKQSP